MRKVNLKVSEKDKRRAEKIRKRSEKNFQRMEDRKKERADREPAEKFQLTPQQEEKALELWKSDKENIDIREICKEIFGFDDLRTNQGRALKDFFISKNIRVKKRPLIQKKEFTLSDEEKKFLVNNKELYESKVELFRNCFDNPELTLLNIESRAAAAFLDEIGYYGFTANPKYLIDKKHSSTKEYKPPTNINQALSLVNSCVKDAIDAGSMTVREKRDLESLVSYMNKNRYLRQITSYEKPEDRTTFEQSFVSYVYDKGDLTQEELDQYIMLSAEVVSGFQTQKLREKTLRSAEELLDSEDNENKSIGKGLVDHAAQLNTEYNQCIKRQESLFKNLTQKRAERLEELKGRDYNLFNLVEAFREQENREKMLKYADKLREETKEKIKEYDDMSEIEAMFLGMSAEEMLYG